MWSRKVFNQALVMTASQEVEGLSSPGLNSPSYLSLLLLTAMGPGARLGDYSNVHTSIQGFHAEEIMRVLARYLDCNQKEEEVLEQ